MALHEGSKNQYQIAAQLEISKGQVLLCAPPWLGHRKRGKAVYRNSQLRLSTELKSSLMNPTKIEG